MTELYDIFNTIIDEFSLKGTLASIYPLSSGNINDTYIMTTDYNGSEKQYIVQRINHKVFQNPVEVAENVCKVTDHIEKKLREQGAKDIRRRVLRYYRRRNGEYYYITPDGNYWRAFSCVYDATSADIADIPILYQTGLAFGEFQRHLLDFPADTLFETIPDFHNTKKRYADLVQAAKENKANRLDTVKEEYDYLLSMEKEACVLCELHEKGELPNRVVHNDTKCNNVMFDIQTGAHLAVIDLDTVMSGLVAYDFGDAVRFAANPGGEDNKSLSKVYLDLDYYSAFAEGFVSEVKGEMTEKELQTLPDGVLAVTLELAARFLTDYLNGDVYFKCKVPHHNLIRTKAQITLAKDVFGKMPELRKRLGDILNEKS
ncbi:MAG: aminoglycoside phosphotransferase family protein [Clostridia bacterium]|nr:aminoglycoside phosphotransferase family protein [Clostridia bacterium]